MIDDAELNSPTKQEHLFDQIHEILWRKILGGEIKPGERLKDSMWAKKLGVSRTPVREAMRKMLQEGILNPLSNGGYEVHAATIADYRGLYKCRAAIDGFAALEIAGKSPKESEAALGAILDACDRAIQEGNFDEAFDLNTSFHRKLVELSGITHLQQMNKSIEKLTLYYRSALYNKARADLKSREEYMTGLHHVQQDHRAIVAAIGRGDGAQARELIERHFLDGVENIAERLNL